jgi:adenylate cyclase
MADIPFPSPLPRHYPAAVTVVRRSARGPAAAPAQTDMAAIEHWLLHEAGRDRDLLAFVESFIWRLVAAGLPLDRFSLHIGTLHPQLIGFSWNWARADGICDEVQVSNAANTSDSYRRNPLWLVFELGETVRCNPQSAEAQARFPLMNDLAPGGMTDYIAFPLSGGGARNALTIATCTPEGFPDDQLDRIRPLLRLFALHIERHTALRISDNALGAYLGSGAAAKVLAGAIRRGAGESMRAVIWVSDLRGFTDLSDRLDPADLLTLLNAYFEVTAGAVLAHGGEVLKFIGDGLLAVFSPQQIDGLATAARAALDAARLALTGLATINDKAPPSLAQVDGWRPLRAGIALHEGEVFFGNIGAPQRLDFTVIGSAVNEASRVEALHKILKRPILVTEAVARHLDTPLDFLGAHALRGVAAPMPIFCPTEVAGE